MFVEAGNALQEDMERVLDRADFKRDCFQKIQRFFSMPNDGKVAVLHGQRRTGKTMLLYQSIAELNDYDRTCFICCQASDSIDEVFDFIRKNPQYRNIFIDDVARISDFINLSRIFADVFARQGRKILMTGVNSLSFALAASDELYNRVHIIRTTFVPFNEWQGIESRDLNQYIQFGGVLGSDAFVSTDSCRAYTFTAVAENLQYSLENWKDGRYCEELADVYPEVSIRELVELTFDVLSRSFLDRAINDLPLVKEQQLLHDFLKRTESHMFDCTKKAIDQIVSYLEIMDVVIKGRNGEYLYTQPGFRFGHVSMLIEDLERAGICSAMNMSEAEEFHAYLSRVVKEYIGRENTDVHSILVEQLDTCERQGIASTYASGVYGNK